VPSVSKKQKKFMDAAAHNPAIGKASGVPVKVAKEFSEASKGMKFGKDTNKSRSDLQKINNPSTRQGKMELMKEGGIMATKKMAKGGSAGNGITTAKMGAVKSGGFKGKGEHAIQSKGISKGTMVSMKADGKPLGMKKGVMTKKMNYGGKAC
jgi:hypothetical protein